MEVMAGMVGITDTVGMAELGGHNGTWWVWWTQWDMVGMVGAWWA